MNRQRRADFARETMEILARGSYTTPRGICVDIGAQVRSSVARSVLFTPEELAALREGVSSDNRYESAIIVTNETTLEAGARLCAAEPESRVACLNFASAKSPGGGFLGGSEAQEESLARASALYPTLAARTRYYEANRGCGTALYTDHVILSPDVPVFRRDDGSLLDEPYRLTFISCPAPNAGALRAQPVESVACLGPTFARRIEFVLAVAAHSGCERLILGAWGCGVFGNRPVDVAGLFAEALRPRGAFRGAFKEIVFAVLDTSEDQRFVGPFRAVFPPEV